MKILTHVDLGKAFESLKNSLIEVEKEVKEDMPTMLETGQKYARAYGRLSAACQVHIASNTDTDYGFVRKALETPKNTLTDEAASEAPTLLLYDQTHWQEEEEGYPDILTHRNDR